MCVDGTFYIHIRPLRTFLTNRFSSFSLNQRNVGLADPNINVPEFLRQFLLLDNHRVWRAAQCEQFRDECYIILCIQLLDFQ